MLFSELKCKDVINVRDCKKLGHVCDLEFDECSGCICKIMVPGGNQCWDSCAVSRISSSRIRTSDRLDRT